MYSMDAKKLVLNQSVLNWLYRPIHATKEAENAWGRALMGKKAWSGAFGEQLVQEYFESLNIPIKRLAKGPDFETEKFFIEVKTGTWKTPGTAHEKIAGVPHKYTEYLKMKKLIIVTIGRAERESKKLFNREFIESEYVQANKFLFVPFSELIRSSFTIDDGSFE
jgi:hypothetical protein